MKQDITHFWPFTLLKRETTFLGKQQLYVFLWYTLAVVLCISLNLLGVSGPQQDVNILFNSLYITVVALLFIGYLGRKVKLTVAISGVILASQVMTTAEMINCAYSPSEYHLMLVVADTVLLAANILFALMVYLDIFAYVLAVLGMGSYIACVVITDNRSLTNFLFIFLVLFVAVCILGTCLVGNMRRLYEENVALKEHEREFFDMVGDDRQAVQAYFDLSRERKNFDSTKALFGMIGERMRHNIIANVREYIMVEEAGMLDMEVYFSELTASEREVCRLVLQGTGLGDMCTILGKKESTITSTRSHIRKKLNMKTGEDLKDVLKKRVKGYRKIEG